MKQKLLLVLLITCISLICYQGYRIWDIAKHPLPKPIQVSGLRDNDAVHLVISRGSNKKMVGSLNVSVVVSLEAMEQGLSGRSAVPSQGMLFVLPKRDIPRFWMKEMLFDLDIVWIDRDTIVDISHNVPAPDSQTALKDLPIYSPTHPATLVLEIPAGQSESLGLQVGNKIHLIAN